MQKNNEKGVVIHYVLHLPLFWPVTDTLIYNCMYSVLHISVCDYDGSAPAPSTRGQTQGASHPHLS